MSKRPTNADFGIAAVFVALITLQPYFLHGKINLFELGLYLPGIDAILAGKVPYRDFFYLRGPFELYMPAALMAAFGKNVAVLSTYFYVGTVITLFMCALIAKELYRSRLCFYLMVPVLVARTFPRVVFTYWGGMRFVFGLFAVLSVIYFFKRRKILWLFVAGAASSLAFLTSVDTGACSIFSIGATFGFAWFLKLEERGVLWKSFLVYGAGLSIILVPYGIYLYAVGALIPYIDAVYSIVIIMTKIFPDSLFENHPSSVGEAMLAMRPWSPHFKHLTPAYCYLFLIGYMGFKIKKKFLRGEDLNFMSVFFYGLILYIFAFRKLGSSVFEMALQPEKILLFFLLETIFLTLREKKRLFKDQFLSKAFIGSEYLRVKIFFINFFFFVFIGSSLGYAVQRYNHRFFSFQYVRNLLIQKKEDLKPLAGVESKLLTLDRVRGMVVPVSQAEDLEQITEFIQKNTKPGETVFMFPELGSYSFVVDRPFVGRFPMVTFSWFGRGWDEELFQDLKKTKPRFAVVQKTLPPYFEDMYFKVELNKQKYDKVISYLEQNYGLVDSTSTLRILKIKEAMDE